MEEESNDNQKKEEKTREVVITGETADEIDSVFDEKERENFEKVEASLFISGKWMGIQDLIMLTDINPIMLKEILHRIEKKYSKGAVRVVKSNNKWKMDVANDYRYLINKLATGSAEFSKAEQETLAVIAYKQPIKQSVVIKIRGNKAYDHIKKFKEIGLVTGKKKGHTYDLLLSDEFYEYFSVEKKKQEQVEEVEASGSKEEEVGGSNGDVEVYQQEEDKTGEQE